MKIIDEDVLKIASRRIAHPWIEDPLKEDGYVKRRQETYDKYDERNFKIFLEYLYEGESYKEIGKKYNLSNHAISRIIYIRCNSIFINEPALLLPVFRWIEKRNGKLPVGLLGQIEYWMEKANVIQYSN